MATTDFSNGTVVTAEWLNHVDALVYGGEVQPQTLTDGATVNWNLASGSLAMLTLGGNRTLAAPTNVQKGRFYLIVKQDSTGGRTLTWNAAYKFAGGTDPVISTGSNAVDVFEFVSDGTSLFCVGIQQNLS